jgi:hypothetical protein
MQRSPSPWDSVLATLRRFVLLIGLALVMSAGGTAQADEQVAASSVRTGVSDDGDSADTTLTRQAPRDAPRLGAGRLSPTPIPAGYNTFDGGWIRFHYRPESREQLEVLISESTAIRRELTERLGMPVLNHVRIDVARTPSEMATLAPRGAPYPDYAAGVAYPEIGLVLLTLTPVHPSSEHDLAQVFRHELAHIALFDAVSGAHVPRWFNEGFAVLASGETSFVRLRTLWTATVADTLLPLSELDAGFPAEETDAEIAYAEAVDVVRFLVRQRERFRFRTLVERLRAGQDFTLALKEAYSIDIVELEQEWREDVAKRYTFWPVLLSGSAVWMATLGLFVVGWRKRKQRAKATLARWAVEEAREEQTQTRVSVTNPAEGRVHIVLARGPHGLPMPPPSEVDVPKVQHEGQWHTLH